ncbi:hypothetical protein FRC03_006303 [Tulasnella sp. 419]|nr:hypothetical protein FRC03_006303 [Tulasnella sp. 419]
MPPLCDSQKINIPASAPPKGTAFRQILKAATKHDKQMEAEEKFKREKTKIKQKLGISSSNTVGYRQQIRVSKAMSDRRYSKYWVSKLYNRNLVTHILQEDFESLSDGQWLGTNMIEFMMDEFMNRYRESTGTSNDLIILPSHVFHDIYHSKGKCKVHEHTTITGKKALDFDFLALPICKDDHCRLVTAQNSDIDLRFIEPSS